MSYQATTVVSNLPYRAVGPMAFRVLLKLADVAQPDGTGAYRFVPHVAAELDVSERTVFRAVAELEAGGLIRRGEQKIMSHWRGGNRPVVWDVNMHGTATLSPLVEDSAFTDDPSLNRCPHRLGKPHVFDPTYGYCSCGAHSGT